MSIKENNLVNILNKLGYVVIDINDRFYVSTKFEEASNNNWKHSMTGKDITDIIHQFIQMNEFDVSKREQIVQKIDNIKKTNKFFHKDIKFVVHLS